MPVVRPWRTSTDTVKAVPSGASLSATIGSRRRRLASSASSGAHTMPDVCRMMKAICSGVHAEAATNRSPSFSRSSSSVTTTSSPRRNDSMTLPMLWRLSVKLVVLWLFGRFGEWSFHRRADLSTLAEIVVGDDACHHGFADRDRADADAGIVAALGDDLGLLAVAVDRAPRRQDRRGRLHGKARHDGLAGGNAAQDTAGV